MTQDLDALGALPDYLIVGAQKCATSSLFSYLQQHPKVRPPSHKEIHFFDSQFRKGVDWYRSHFPMHGRSAGNDWQTGEASPSYLLNPHCAGRIKRVLGEVKLIISLRNPVDRAFSHYRHNVKRGREISQFHEAIQNEHEMMMEWRKVLQDESYPDQALRDGSYLLRGHYLNQMERYLEHFPRSMLHVIIYDDIVSNPQAVMAKLCEFLELEQHTFDFDKRLNVGVSGSMASATRRLLASYYTESNHQLSQYLGRDLEWS